VEATTGSAATPRAVAAYLVELRGPLAEATHHRKVWVHSIGVLMEDARRGNPLTITQSAGQFGREHGASFRRVREQVGRLTPPTTCVGVHRALVRWLDKLVQACDLLVAVARDGDIRRLRETQGLFSEGRHHAHVFNDEYARVVADLRERVAHHRDRARRASARAAGPTSWLRQTGPALTARAV
jgi:hypothetical protein